MRRIAALIVLFCFACRGWCAYPDSPPLRPKVPIPESGYLSARQYTNAFFGFTIALPKSGHFQIRDFSEKNDSRLRHFLLSETSLEKGLTEWSITATQVFRTPDEEAEKAVIFREAEKQGDPGALSISRKLFWKNEVQTTVNRQKLYQVRYATAIHGFVLKFSIYSYNGKLKEEICQNIEDAKFFDPANMNQELAADSQPYLPNAARWWLTNAPELDLTRLDTGTLAGTTYINSHLGFSYSFPSGWRIALGNPGENEGRSGKPAALASAQPQEFSPQCIRVLASAIENTSGSGDQAFNNRITILAADPTCYAPDQKYPDSIGDSTTLEVFGSALIRAFSGSPLMGRSATTVRAAQIGGHILFQIPSSASTPMAGTALRRKIHRLFVLTSMQQYWVIWLLESDTESELSKLLKTSISFDKSHSRGSMP